MIHEMSDVHMLYEMDSAHAVLGIPLSWCVCAALFVWYIHMVLYHVVCYPAVLLLLHDHGCGYRDPSSHDHHGVYHPPTIHLTGCGVCPMHHSRDGITVHGVPLLLCCVYAVLHHCACAVALLHTQ